MSSEMFAFCKLPCSRNWQPPELRSVPVALVLAKQSSVTFLLLLVCMLGEQPAWKLTGENEEPTSNLDDEFGRRTKREKGSNGGSKTERELTVVADYSVAVQVGLSYHVVHLFVGQLFAQICHHQPELWCAYETVAISIENPKCLSIA